MDFWKKKKAYLQEVSKILGVFQVIHHLAAHVSVSSDSFSLKPLERNPFLEKTSKEA